MNIFYLDEDVTTCAKSHCDKHVVKMILESAQMLCAAHSVSGQLKPPYALVHKNHPCTAWVRASKNNYLYLCSLAKQLCKEYTYRYSKRHKSEDVIDWCTANTPVNLPDTPFVQPPQAMPSEYKSSCSIDAYRKYYIGEKLHFAKWTNRQRPAWIHENILENTSSFVKF